MAKINWNDSLSVKVREFDIQHQKLISLINQLHDAMKEGKGKKVVGQIVNELIEYTDSHFQTEERYFAEYNYPDYKNHKDEHDAFVKKVVDFKDDLEKGKITLSIEINKFLSDWLKNHILGTDQKYSEFFNNQGLK